MKRLAAILIFACQFAAQSNAFGQVPATGEIPMFVDASLAQNVITTNRSSVTVIFGSEPGELFECSVGGAPYEQCYSPRTLTELNSGKYEFRVRDPKQKSRVNQLTIIVQHNR